MQHDCLLLYISSVPDNSGVYFKNLNNWVHCFCALTFDLEVGQSLEIKYPNEAELTKTEVLNICYLSFPDSNSDCLGDTQFYFRIRRSSRGKEITNPQLVQYNKILTQIIFLVLFFFDKLKTLLCHVSMVLLTQLPLVNFYQFVVCKIAPAFFSAGLPLIEAVSQEMNHWDPPVPGALLNLPLMGSVIKLRLPSRIDKPGVREDLIGLQKMNESCYTLLNVYEPDLYECLSLYLPHLHMLWELPIVIMAPSPDVSSVVVQSLISLIWPLQYRYDYRPYFTIQDSDFKEYLLSQPGIQHHVILGTTNLYFIKAMENWPHVLRLSTDSKRKGKRISGAHKIRRHIGLKGMEEKSGKCYFNFMAASIEINMNFKGIHTNRPKEAQSMMIRRHFMDLTHSFLFPLEQYVANTMPLQKDISPWKDAPRLREFDKEEFLKFVENADLPSRTGIKGDWINLYRLFCDTKTFTYWLKQRQTEVNTRLRMLHLEALAGATVDCTLQSKIEVEVVDFILKLRDALSFAESHRELVNDELLCRVNDHYRKALQYKMFISQTLSIGMTLWRKKVFQSAAVMVRRCYCKKLGPIDEECEEVKAWRGQLTDAEQERLKVAIYEYNLYKYADATLPSNLNVSHLRKLLLMDTKTLRLKYLTYLGKKEKRRVREEEKKREKIELGKQIKEKIQAERANAKHITYALGHNFIMRRMIDTTMNKIDDARLIFASMFAPKIVFDMGFLSELSPIETDLTWIQLREAYYVNRNHQAPFAVHLTDCNFHHPSWSESQRYFMGGLPTYALDMDSENFTKLYDPRQLVYLSPDARKMLDSVEPDKVYIIGAMVDKPNKTNCTLGKAKQFNIAAAKLPIDKYIKWECGSKSLTLNQVLSILLEVNSNGGDWAAAFLKHVPKRKLVNKDTRVSKLIRQQIREREEYMLSLHQ
ncbi:putative tRNA (guanine-N(1)-)-methyltransferase [Trichinella nativa]|uniref:Putative tRNA (Guanine-N(1)-)-methyltransferase n=1 Tax=Trichinella nativa TaxID=6335 RepID=A0A1Y3E4V6_9BILA|nr:putative tRNA (guanine-N(1)-)-methyltransferase [Trichinella nativa]